MFLKARLFKSLAGTITSFVAKLGYLNKIFNCSQKFYGPAPRDDSGLSCIFSVVMCSIMSDHALYRSDVALTVCCICFGSVILGRLLSLAVPTRKGVL